MIGLENQGHPFAFEFGVTFDLGVRRQLFLNDLEEIVSQVQVGHFSATELERELHLVSVFQEFTGMINLDLEIVLTDPDGFELQFLELSGFGMRPGFLLFFLLLVSPFAVIEDFADWRAGVGGYLDQIQTGFTRESQSFSGGDDAHHFIFFINQSNGRNANLLVVAKIGTDGATPKNQQNQPRAGGFARPKVQNTPSVRRIDAEILIEPHAHDHPL